MSKNLYIAEKPSVAQEFAKAIKENFRKGDGFMESEGSVVTWCVGHLVTMSYPEVYDPSLKKWSLETLPFLPQKYKYEIIQGVSKQFNTVKKLLNRQDVGCIYVCTDSGREGEYIYRLVDTMAGVPGEKPRRRVWIDSQTEEEILRGIREAKELREYDRLSDAAYLRAKEDYLMGINFSRALTLTYGSIVQNFMKTDKWSAISVGRVMTCVLGMVVRREREIRSFVKTSFYRVVALIEAGTENIEAEFRAVEGSTYFQSPLLYKENGFKKKETAEELIAYLEASDADKNTGRAADGSEECEKGDILAEIVLLERKKEQKRPPLLFNLAELQNECSRLFKISPDETLKITQELYEKKLVTYPRTDARVLSTAVAKEITKNLQGIKKLSEFTDFVGEIFDNKAYAGLEKTRYVNDKQITDHYAIIPTGQVQAAGSLNALHYKVFTLIARRFISIFYPPAVYQKLNIVFRIKAESFFAGFKGLLEPGYFKVTGIPVQRDRRDASRSMAVGSTADAAGRQEGASGQDGTSAKLSQGVEEEQEEKELGTGMLEEMKHLRKGMRLPVKGFAIKEGETTPPKRYNSGSLILAMENAGQLIEDEELRAQIKGSGIGTSATRAEILNKLVKIAYLALNKKTQIVTPSLQGELVFEVVYASIRPLLNAELTASWEKGLTYVTEGTITKEEYMNKLEGFVRRNTDGVKKPADRQRLMAAFNEASAFYRK